MTSEEAYREIVHMENLLLTFGSLIIILVAFQIVAKTIIFAWVIRLLQKVETLLRLVEGHARVTDSQRNRVMEEVKDVRQAATVAAATAAELSRKVDEMPTMVADKIKGADSGKLTPLSDPNVNIGS